MWVSVVEVLMGWWVEPGWRWWRKLPGNSWAAVIAGHTRIIDRVSGCNNKAASSQPVTSVVHQAERRDQTGVWRWKEAGEYLASAKDGGRRCRCARIGSTWFTHLQTVGGLLHPRMHRQGNKASKSTAKPLRNCEDNLIIGRRGMKATLLKLSMWT